MDVYLCMSETFSIMANRAYERYRIAVEQRTMYEDGVDLLSLSIDEIEKYKEICYTQISEAISVVVFQAFAIENYINLYGAIELTPEVFYSEIEPPKDEKPKNFHYLTTTEKLKEICRRMGKNYPSTHLNEIEKLFTKRNRLAHTKPKPHLISILPFDYENPSASFMDYLDAGKEIAFIYEGLEKEILLYEELRVNLTALRDAGIEIIIELNLKNMETIYTETNEMLLRAIDPQRMKGEM